MKKVAALDGIRGLAVFMVMTSHFIFSSWADSPVYRILQSGWLGVNLFFVLSGYLITVILLDTAARSDYFWRFYKRRALRIFPLYYFAITLVWLVVVFIEKAPHLLQGYDDWRWFVFFSCNIAMALKGDWLYHSNYLGVNHLWSVALEEQFYMVWPLVVRFLKKNALFWLCLTIVLGTWAVRIVTDLQFGACGEMAAYTLPYCRMDGLAMGALLAVIGHFFGGVLIEKWSVVVRWICIVTGLTLLLSLIHSIGYLQGTVSAIFFGTLVTLALNPHPQAGVRRWMEHPFLQDLGKYSYALYVFHHMPYWWCKTDIVEPILATGFSPMLLQVLYFVAAFAISYLAARLSWRFLEEPFLKLKGK